MSTFKKTSLLLGIPPTLIFFSSCFSFLFLLSSCFSSIFFLPAFVLPSFCSNCGCVTSPGCATLPQQFSHSTFLRVCNCGCVTIPGCSTLRMGNKKRVGNQKRADKQWAILTQNGDHLFCVKIRKLKDITKPTNKKRFGQQVFCCTRKVYFCTLRKYTFELWKYIL